MPRLKRITAALSTTEGKLKAVILVGGSAILLAVLAGVAFSIMGTPAFCQSCHEMRPEYVTWKAGDHSKIACTACHIERSQPGYAVKAFFKESYLHLTGKVNVPIEVDKSIEDSVCEQCHSTNRVPTPSGDIKIPHKVHKEAGIPCVQCHGTIMHANIAEGGFTARRGLDNWSEPVGKAYMQTEFLKFSMRECLNCHNENDGAPTYTDCTACHSKLVKPASHKAGSFLTEHGKEAFQDIKICDQCHKLTMTSKDVRVVGDNPVVVYARQNAFCAGCHTNPDKKPASHGTDWRLTHRIPASQNKEYCMVCHDEGKPTKLSVATKTGCSQCHLRYQHSLNFENHTKYPLPKNTSKITELCRSCHGDTCAKCHYLPWKSGP